MSDPGTEPVSLERAWEGLARAIPPASTEEIDLAGAAGRFLAQDIRAARARPAAAQARADGYALAPGPPPPLPAVLPIVGYASPARPLLRPVPEGAAVRVDRGTPLPAIAPFAPMEGTALVGTERVRIEALSPDAIEPAAGEFTEGDVLLHRGTRIRAAQGLLLAAAGATYVPVLALPRVTIVPIGDELIGGTSGAPAREDLNSPWVAGRLEAIGFDVRVGRPIADDSDAIGLALLRASERGVAIGTGGLGSGYRDRTCRALRGLRLPEPAGAVAVEPAGTTALARGPSGAIAVIPGDPYEAAIAIEAILIPALAAALGLDVPHMGTEAPAAVILGERTGCAARILPVRWTPGDETAEPLPPGLRSLACCGGLALIPPGAPAVPAGARGRIHRPGG
ncbi:MAG: hypothetical protein JXP34_22680 [Planctomycetes bacterium]|nr:hypothetical protein [Planctomycetota bacterium]